MDHKTRGIILHTIKYSESSVIAKIYTEKFGLLSFLVKGVRASKSKNKASMMQPLTLLDMVISYRETRGRRPRRPAPRDQKDLRPAASSMRVLPQAPGPV